VKKVVAAVTAITMLALPALTQATHPRPLSAHFVHMPLVPAYEQCAAPDRMHGPPLVHGSCSGPQQASDHLTVGTFDANGSPARSVGSFRIKTRAGTPGPPTDNQIAFYVQITDVRCKRVSAGCPGPGEDYSGTMEARIPIRITDHHNGPPPDGDGRDAATGQTTIPFEVGCAATADPGIGSTCSVNIDFIEHIFLTVNDGDRTSWEFGSLQLWDGGADGDGLTPADNTLFADQGLFVP
jgi:hypothetical protein